MFEVNVMSGVRLTRHYLKRMLDNKDWGRVVFVNAMICAREIWWHTQSQE
jgi:NAD(P)-dependent dehydrogenase (short-subunit alcohol dehydrogenase family)